LPEGSTVAVALAAIIQKHGSTLTPLIFNSEQRQASAALLLAIGEQQAVVDSELYDGASLLLLPPVSGGQ
jgi:molybdopterin converting factor small subunit